jgi:hypothetical protein
MMNERIVHLPEALKRRLSEAVERSNCSEAEWVIEALTWALEHDQDDPLLIATRTTNRQRSGRTCRTVFQ